MNFLLAKMCIYPTKKLHIYVQKNSMETMKGDRFVPTIKFYITMKQNMALKINKIKIDSFEEK